MFLYNITLPKYIKKSHYKDSIILKNVPTGHALTSYQKVCTILVPVFLTFYLCIADSVEDKKQLVQSFRSLLVEQSFYCVISILLMNF
jgi:hypothetical protein